MNYINKPFEVVCTKCVESFSKAKLPYKGVVNHDYLILSPGHLVIRYRCFTCNTYWEQDINFQNFENQTPKDKKDFEARLKREQEKRLPN